MKVPWSRKKSFLEDNRFCYPILDTPTHVEEEFDDVTCLAAYICKTPVAFVSLRNENQQWSESKVGMATSTAYRYRSLIAQTVQQSDLLIVPDLLADDRLATLADSRSDGETSPHTPNLRFYCGYSLTLNNKVPLGVLAVMDYEPRELTSEQQQALRALGRLLLGQIRRREPLTNGEPSLASPPAPLSLASLVLDIEGRIIDWDRGAEKLYGWSKPEVIGQVADQLLQTSFSEATQKIEEQFWHQGYWEGAVRQSRRDRVTMALTSHWIVMRDDKGQPVAKCQINYHSQNNGSKETTFASVAPLPEAIDPTLAPAENCLQSIASHIPGAIYRLSAVDNQWKVEFISDIIEKISGYPAEEWLEGRCTWANLIHPEDRQRVQQARELLEMASKSYILDYRIVHAAGQVKWVSDRGIKIADRTDSNESVRSWIDGVIFEIAEPKQMEESVQSSHRQLAYFLDNITDAFFTLDRQWRFTYLNFATEQIWHKNKDELIGKCVWDEFPKLGGSTFEFAARRSVQERVTIDCETFYAPLLIWLEVRTYPNPDGLSVYFRDVTQQKQTEDTSRERLSGTALSRLSALAAGVGMALGASCLSEVLTQCTRAAVEHLDVIGARIWTCNPNTSQLELQTIAGEQTLPEDTLGESSLLNFIANNREPLSGYVRTFSGKLRAIGIQPLPDSGLRAISGGTSQPSDLSAIGATTGRSKERQGKTPDYFAGYPLIVEERLVGIMALYSSQPLSEDVRSMLEWVTKSIAIAIDRSWAREALLKRREGLLFRMANQIRNSLDLNTILETAVHEIRNLLQIDRCHFLWYLPHPETPSLMVTHEARSADLPSLLSDCPPQFMDFLSTKIVNMQILRVDDVEREADSSPEYALLKTLAVTSQLLLPLETRAGQLGAVVCSHCSGPRPWGDSEVELVQAVVNQLAIAIDQAELYAQTHAAALAAQTQAQQLSEALHNLKQTQAQLVQSEKMSSLGQMVAGVAHEINNPVNFIYGNLTYASNYIQEILSLLDLYQKHYSNPVPDIQQRIEDMDLAFIIEDLPKILSSMEMGADRIRQIVLSLRNFSRLDEAEKKSVDVHEGLDNTLLILHNRLKPKGKNSGIQIVKEYGDIPRIECYPGQLNQVFMNILSNAIDALENRNQPGKICIRTEILDKTENLASNRSWLVIRISDNGPGMSEEVKRRLFDPFFTTKPVGKGTGLGLSISYQIIVEKHGGILKCLSEVGQGSEFWIQIPMLWK